jgi:hypothetical protein
MSRISPDNVLARKRVLQTKSFEFVQKLGDGRNRGTDGTIPQLRRNGPVCAPAFRREDRPVPWFPSSRREKRVQTELTLKGNTIEIR